MEQARGLLDDEHPLCFGYADGALNPTARRFREADVALLLGKRLDHRYRYGGVFSTDAKLIQVDPSPAEIGRNRGVAVGIQGDLGAVGGAAHVGDLDVRGAQRGQVGLGRPAPAGPQRLGRGTAPARPPASRPCTRWTSYTGLEKHLDEDSVVIFDGGDYVQWGRAYMKARKPGHFMRLGPLSHLGAGIPYGMAAKLAHPEAKVLVFIGDGAFGFYSMEYDTCIRHNLAITTVLGNDATWGIDKTFQVAYYGRAVGTDLRHIRYDKVVEAIGGYTEHVEEPSEVAAAVGRALASGQPSPGRCFGSFPAPARWPRP